MGRTVDRRRHTSALGKSHRWPRRFGYRVGSDYSAGANTPMNHARRRSEVRRQKEGAAIMLALWALFLLSALVISWALDIDSRLALSGDGARMLKAEAVACSGAEVALHPAVKPGSDRKSTRLNSSHSQISYAVFCLKKKK